MSTRIGLFTNRKNQKRGQSTTTKVYVEVKEPKELSSKLAELGAKRVALLCRNRTGTTRMEGKMFSPADITAEHITWLVGKAAEFETRGLFYD